MQCCIWRLPCNAASGAAILQALQLQETTHTHTSEWERTLADSNAQVTMLNARIAGTTDLQSVHTEGAECIQRVQSADT